MIKQGSPLQAFMHACVCVSLDTKGKFFTPRQMGDESATEFLVDVNGMVR